MKLTAVYGKSSLLLVFVIAAFVAGCGGKTDSKSYYLPDGGTITVGPAHSQTGAPPTAQCVDLNVVARYEDTTVAPNIVITISGSMATGAFPTALYQFYRFPNCNADVNNIAVNSGFSAITDDYGAYHFSALILPTGYLFKDNVVVSSGAIFGTTTIEIK